MPDRKDKRSRKESLDRWKADQRSAARTKLPLPNEQMQALFEMLDTELPSESCDHTLRLTRAWLTSEKLPVVETVTWLQENGGFCDCEALANAEQAWRDAVHDVNW
jgi:hypothetical protein